MKMRLLAGLFGAVLLSCSGGGNANNANENNASNGAKLPWPSPFFEAGYSQAEVVSLAAALRDAKGDEIPSSLRDELTGHIEMLLSAPSPSALTFEPTTESEAWVMAGVSSVFQGSLAVGTWCFSNAVLADPADEQALNQLGWALLADERLEEGRGVLLHGTELEPRLWSLWSNLGHAADLSGEPDRAIYYFGLGLEQHPESLNMHLRLGGLLLDRGEIIAAASHAAHALAISPTDPDVLEFEDEVKAVGGDTATVSPAPSFPRSDGMRDVRRDFDDCVEGATQRYSESMAPSVRQVLLDDQNFRLALADAQAALRECEAGCDAASDACFDGCLSQYCGTATAAEVGNHMRHLRVASADMAYSAALRTRIRGCAYTAVETYEDDVTEADIQEFLLYVSWLCEMMAEGSLASFLDDQADIADRLPVASECPDAGSIPVEELTLTFDLESLGISTGIETCLDSFACLSFGETSFGWSVGIGVISGGVEIDYGTPDVVFSVGPGYDAAVGSVGVDLKLSIQHGIGVSPNLKVGGVIRSTYARDFWLLSF